MYGHYENDEMNREERMKKVAALGNTPHLTIDLPLIAEDSAHLSALKSHPRFDHEFLLGGACVTGSENTFYGPHNP